MKKLNLFLAFIFGIFLMISCGDPKGGADSFKKPGGALSTNAAERVYVAPGEYDEFYAFISGGFSGQVSVYGLPSGTSIKSYSCFLCRCRESVWIQ